MKAKGRRHSDGRGPGEGKGKRTNGHSEGRGLGEGEGERSNICTPGSRLNVRAEVCTERARVDDQTD